MSRPTKRRKAVNVQRIVENLIRYSGLSANAVAKQLGVSPQHLGEVRNGTRRAGDKLCAKLGITRVDTTRYYA